MPIDMASAPVSLPAHCATCHGAVTMEMYDWPLGLAETAEFPHDHPSVRKSVWTCPHCNVLNIGEFPGRVATVTKNEAAPATVLDAIAATGLTNFLLD